MNPDDFRRLSAAGLSTEQIAIVMEMMERDAKAVADADEARKAKGRDRVAKWRLEHGRNVTVTAPDVTVRLTGERVPVEDKTSNLDIEPLKEEKKETRVRAFDAFWAAYPHRVGKAEALKAFSKAERRVDLETLMAGLHRYVAKTDDRPWCNPATWLNQDRWTDEPAAPVARAGPLLSRPNPGLAAVDALMEKLDAAASSQTEANQAYPRLVAFSGGG